MQRKERKWWLKEQPIPIHEARKLFASPPTYGTIWRWWRAGYRGVKLRTYRECFVRMTTREEVQRFKERVSELYE